MSSLIPGYSYDIFISYRQKDNKHDGWVTEFVDNLKGELESTFKEEVSVYFDINPHDGLLETHDVDASLKEKLNCLVFIPIISQTYCDLNSFAWQNEFCAFNELAKEDKFGRDIRLSSGNVTSRILPVKIHDLDPEDKKLLENEIGRVFRCVEFIYKSAGVNRPLQGNEDHPQDNLNKTYYRDQINKVANAVKEIITALKKQSQHSEEASEHDFKIKPSRRKNLVTKVVIGSIIALALIVTGYFVIPKIFRTPGQIEKSIAVLPFANLSNDPDQEFFVDGMVDEILDRLFKVGELKVISRTSSMRYKNTKLSLKDIAHELGVSAILEGSVRKIGNDVRITVQLIDAKTDTHLWSDTFDGNLTDAFTFQSNVALGVARELKATLTSKETTLIQNATHTSNQAAYNFYLRGNDYFSKLKTDSAIISYTKAIQEDPFFAAAFAKRATAHIYRYWTRYRGWQGHDQEAREDIKIGLKLNSELPELKMTEAAAYYHLDRNYDEALKILKELKEEVPNMADAYAYTSYILRRQGKLEESISEAKRGIQLDPVNANYINNLSGTYHLLHQYDNQIECCQKELLLIPDSKTINLKIFNAYLDMTADLKIALKRSEMKEDNAKYAVYYYNKLYDKLLDFIRQDTSLVSDQLTYQPKTFRLAFINYIKGDKSLCKIYADSAILHLNEKIKEDPVDDRYYATLGKCYAITGINKEAITYGKKAMDLKPARLDFYQGVAKEQDLMEIYLITGNYDLALDKIEHLLSAPSWLSVGKLTIDPLFDSIRSLPRFKKIIENARK